MVSQNVSMLLDKIANSLESKGFLREAYELDIVSNTLDVDAGMGNLFLKAKEKIKSFMPSIFGALKNFVAGIGKRALQIFKSKNNEIVKKIQSMVGNSTAQDDVKSAIMSAISSGDLVNSFHKLKELADRYGVGEQESAPAAKMASMFSCGYDVRLASEVDAGMFSNPKVLIRAALMLVVGGILSAVAADPTIQNILHMVIGNIPENYNDAANSIQMASYISDVLTSINAETTNDVVSVSISKVFDPSNKNLGGILDIFVRNNETVRNIVQYMPPDMPVGGYMQVIMEALKDNPQELKNAVEHFPDIIKQMKAV